MLLMSRKQLLISEIMQMRRKETFTNLFLIPYFDKQGKIKGSQFVLKEDEQVVSLLDQEINTLYHHSSEMLQYGHQKFLTAEDSHEEYILVVSCQFKQKVYLNNFFENSEAYYILHKIQKKLLSMQLAKFEYFVLNDDFDQLMREEFYQAQEVLQGKSIHDLCLTFPKEVSHGLKQSQNVYSSISGSLAEEISVAEESVMGIYKKLDLCEENLLIQIDFNFCSTLRIAAELNAN